MAKPRRPGIAGVSGRQVEPQKVRIESDTGIDQAQPPLIGKPLERRVILRADVGVGHQVDLAGLHTQRLGGLIGDDDRELVEVRAERFLRRPFSSSAGCA